MSSPKRLARIAGLLYLIVDIFGGFAIAYVTATVYVPGEAATGERGESPRSGYLQTTQCRSGA